MMTSATRLCLVAACLAAATPVRAQTSVSEVLSFLLVNRSIPTDDFVRDEQATAATRDSISSFLLNELATVPVGTSAAAFTYRLNTTLGTMERASSSFGAFYTDRSLTTGKGQSSFNLGLQVASFDRIDGRSLQNGSLVSIASQLEGAAEPFDVETVTLRIRTSTVTLIGTYGVTDRLDVSGAVPFVRLTLRGQRIDTYRGQESLQATGSGSAAGVGDVFVRAKYNLVQRGGSGVAVGAEARMPTGNSDNLLGTGEFAFKPRMIASFESDRVGVHGDVGWSLGGLSREITYAAALTAVAHRNITVVGEIAGRRFEQIGRLQMVSELHPRLVGVETIRLTGVPQALTRVIALGGVKWNVASTWLVSANVMKPLTSAGLNAEWVPSITVDYAFGR
jgi:hypothetical protein